MKKNFRILHEAFVAYKNNKHKKAISLYKFLTLKNTELAQSYNYNIKKIKKITPKSTHNDNCILLEIPIFNNLDYAEKCIERILEKTDYDVEIKVIMNDAPKSYLLVYLPFSLLDVEENCKTTDLILENFIKNTRFFDEDFYKKQYKISENPAEHFIYEGFTKGHLPARWFDIKIGRYNELSSLYEKNDILARAQKNRRPKVSILVPVYNNAQYLMECFDSIIYQTLPEIEIIILNDGSTDKESIDIMEEYNALDERVKLIYKKNTGYGHTMNVGLHAANGEYIGIVESDDYIDFDMYNRLYSTVEKEKVDFVKCNYQIFYGEENERSFVDKNIILEDKHNNTTLNPRENHILFKMSNVIWNGIYKKNFLDKYNILFNETPGASFQDNGFWFQIYMYTQKMYIIPDMLYKLRRDNPDSSVFSKEKVFSFCDEYYFIEKILRKNTELKNLLINIFFERKFGNYIFNLRRIDKQYREIFVDRMYNEYKKSFEDNEIIQEKVGKKTYNHMLELVENPSLFLENRKKYLDENPVEIVQQPQAISANVKKDYNFYKSLNHLHYEAELKKWYEQQTKKELNLHNPKTFNEKIQWLKLYENDIRKSIFSDKFLVRNYISNTIGDKYLIPILGVYSSFDEINFETLPEKFVIKCTHGCGYNIVVKNKKNLDIGAAKTKIDKWMSENYAFKFGLELHYKTIEPRIIIEIFLENNTEDLYDYKIWCFNGKAHFIQFLSDRFSESGLKMIFFDRDWNELDFVYTYPKPSYAPPKPENLHKLLLLAEKLSKGFNHVRVDFYRQDNGDIYFGELTFTSASGVCKWEPKEYDKIIGDYFPFKCKKLSQKNLPLVSIVTPAYNASQYINRSIESLISQTYENVELIYVNDGSTDDTAEIIKSYTQSFQNIKMINTKNTGAGEARNIGLQKAKGKYIMFLDADDYFMPDMIEKMVTKIGNTKSDICICGSESYDSNTHKTCFNHHTIKKQFLPNKTIFSPQDIKNNIFTVFATYPWDKMYKKQFILENNLCFLNLKSTNDSFFVLLSILLSQKITYTDEILIKYYTNLSNSITVNSVKNPEDFAFSLQEIKNYLLKLSIFYKYEQDFINYFIAASIYKFKIYPNEVSKKLIEKIKNHYFFEFNIYNKTENYFYEKNKYYEFLSYLK